MYCYKFYQCLQIPWYTLYVKKQITFISLIAFVIFNSKFQKLVFLSVFNNNKEVEIPLQQAWISHSFILTVWFHYFIICSQGLADNTVVAKVDGELWDLDRPFEKDSSLQLLKFDDKDGINLISIYKYIELNWTAGMMPINALFLKWFVTKNMKKFIKITFGNSFTKYFSILKITIFNENTCESVLNWV